MHKKMIFKIVIPTAAMLIVLAGIFQVWSRFRRFQEDFLYDLTEYQSESLEKEREITDDEIYMSNTPQSDSSGKDIYSNPETSYRALIEDDAQLLDEEEEQALAALMQEITVYGNVAFKTIDSNNRDTESYARQYYKEQFGTASGTLFLIDMDNRNIWIHSDGNLYKVITKSYANTITDNVYRYASGGDYYDCAAHTYEQILALLKGHKIAQPMKYISNGLLAVILALLLNYGLVCFFARIKKPDKRELLRNGQNHFHYTQPRAFFVRESRTYNPTSSSSGGSSGSSGSSGGGGSSSGGGGGHSF
ncbi:MAG: TPM domain-containing protein [Lachnospiraceae bacterium]|nr:TPM domain-containing protein [Lachnospiraceae bacterium]